VHKAMIRYYDADLEACERDDIWIVRSANLEARARYLDLALAELLGNSQEGHRAAARLLTKLEDVVEQQQTQASNGAPPEPRTRRPRERREASSILLTLGFRVVLFAIISSTTFMLTTWLTTLR
jgi:hypothetical protein